MSELVPSSTGPAWCPERRLRNIRRRRLRDRTASAASSSERNEAAGRILEADVHRVLVVDESERLLGIVRSADVVRALAERGLEEEGEGRKPG